MCVVSEWFMMVHVHVRNTGHLLTVNILQAESETQEMFSDRISKHCFEKGKRTPSRKKAFESSVRTSR